MAAILGHVVRKNLGPKFHDAIYVTDSTIAMYWINMDQRPLETAVRNCVIEIRRFSEPKDWHHIDTNLNIADLGTRLATVDQISEGSEWQDGKAWMKLPRDQMPIKTMQEVSLTADEKRQAAKEMKKMDVQGIMVAAMKDKVSDR